MLSSALWFWFLILFPSRLNRSVCTFPFPAFFTSFLFPLGGAELQKDLEAAVEGAAPGDLFCEADPLLRWSLCRKTFNSIFSGTVHLVEYVRLHGTAALALLLLQHRLTPPVNLVMEILAGLCVSFSFCPQISLTPGA